jgi:gamma-glutamyltranspeptidase/glutathione hydrolase
MVPPWTLAVLIVLVAGWALPALGQAPPRDPEPAVTLPWAEPGRTAAVATSYMVAAANPLAVEAGLEVLRAGGSAADAAIAVQLVLNLVEPQSSGIGGGAFALHWQASGRRLRTYDGRETAPAAAKSDRFLEDGQPLPFGEAIFGGLSVGVPGTVRLLETLHKEHAKLPWAQLFAPAIRLAEGGFHVSRRLTLSLRWYGAHNFSPRARAYFFDRSGSPRAEGSLLKNPEFAATLRAIAEQGADAFYQGGIAQAMVEAVRQAPSRPGDLTVEDLAGYRVKARDPVCFGYRRNRICGMGPPSSGGVAVGQILKVVEVRPTSRHGVS